MFGSKLEWRTGLGRATRDEPATRSNKYVLSEIEEIRFDSAGLPYFVVVDTNRVWESGGLSGSNMFIDLDDRDAHFAADWTLPLSKTNGAKIKTGVHHQNKTRTQSASRWLLNNHGGTPAKNNLADSIFTSEAIGPDKNQFELESQTKAGDRYDVSDHNIPFYLIGEIPIIHRLRMIGGVRFEDNEMNLHSDSIAARDFYGLVRLKTGDWLPMASIVYRLSDKMNLRGVYSQTLDRPEYREIAPFSYQDYVLGRPKEGNPRLKTAYIKNYDLRWEWFPRPGELFAVSVFAKKFDGAIEFYILDEDYQLTQEGKVFVDGQEKTEEFTIERYSIGRSFTFGMSFGL